MNKMDKQELINVLSWLEAIKPGSQYNWVTEQIEKIKSKLAKIPKSKLEEAREAWNNAENWSWEEVKEYHDLMESAIAEKDEEIRNLKSGESARDLEILRLLKAKDKAEELEQKYTQENELKVIAENKLKAIKEKLNELLISAGGYSDNSERAYHYDQGIKEILEMI